MAPPPPPSPAIGTAQPDLAILAQFNPFLGADTPAGGRAATGDGLRLYGVRADGSGSGSAIIGSPDGRQASYGVGDTVAPGVTLQSVRDNHVVLSRGGAASKLAFPDPAP